jgi:hypothetical protein
LEIQAVRENASRQAPLGLPAGSVRAALTLLLLAVAVIEISRGHELPGLWGETLLIAVAYYFSSTITLRVGEAGFRQLEENGTLATEPNPLFLPRGAVPLLIVVGLGIAGYVLNSRNAVPSIAEMPSAWIGTAAFLLGSFWRWIFRHSPTRERGTLRRPWGPDLFALSILLLMTGLALVYFLDQSQVLPDSIRKYALAAVLFYFGSR